ncbi:two-component system response regulator [Longimonas halophila]|uniref:Two-component system response regulator n=1 Tax=Longimonas halophila TaxID=1469170 RepID=A0A2H3P476_9BACT|nr:response regulator [Longimonas halophila]PEN05189.1 two-component system response regulator [Longimonas halophila]
MSRSILLIEDQPYDAELTLRALRELGLDEDVMHLRDGAEALRYLFQDASDHGTPPKLILLDLKLPKVSGLEVLEALKSDERTHCIPVIALTSSQEQQDLTRCYDLGVNSYVVKPVDFEQFTETVQRIGRYWTSTNQTVC